MSILASGELRDSRGIINQRGQQLNNTQDKSVSASSNKSKGSRRKASGQRQTRQESYRKKFGNRPHMIIPIEDLEFIETQKPSVVQLWLASWRCDPYGSRWQMLNHNLSYSAFKKAKKILIDQGLFVFKAENSMRDNRETTHWSVMNLHGARRTDYWLDNESKKEDYSKNEPKNHKKEDYSKNEPKNSKNCQDSTKACQDSTKACQDSTKACQDLYKASIESESLTEQLIQTPSETSQEHLSNSSKELLEVLPGDLLGRESDRDLALEGQVTSASLTEKNVKTKETAIGGCLPPNPQGADGKEENRPDSDSGFVNKSNQNLGQANQSLEKDSETLSKKSTNDPFEEPYEFDWRSGKSIERSKAQISAFEAEKKTKEYQDKVKAGFAQIRAIFEEKKKQKIVQRRANLRGDSPMTLEEHGALEEYKAEIQKRFREQE